MNRRMSIFDLSIFSFMGLFDLGYAAGLGIARHWPTCIFFGVLAVLFLLWGDGVRLTVKR